MSPLSPSGVEPTRHVLIGGIMNDKVSRFALTLKAMSDEQFKDFVARVAYEEQKLQTLNPTSHPDAQATVGEKLQ